LSIIVAWVALVVVGMVLTAPLFLLSQTRAIREYAASNREPLVRLGLGSVIAWLSLRLLSKTYETVHVTAESARVAAASRAILEVHESPSWLSTTADAVARAAPASRATTLRELLAAARVDAEMAVARGAASGDRVRDASALAKATEASASASTLAQAPPARASSSSDGKSPAAQIRSGII
jgi:hypothetical protein